MREQLLISATALKQRIDAGDPVVVADCTFNLGDTAAGEMAWQTAHIPGAQYWHLERDLSGPIGETGGRHPLPAAADFEQCMRRSGVNADTLVVVYDNSRAAMASRAWWLLRYFGHKNVRVLDGGLNGWLDAGFALTSDIPTVSPGNFRASAVEGMKLDYEVVAASATEECILVDARDERRFKGLEEPIDPIAGHIPGAINKPFTEAVDARGYWLDDEAQRARWSDMDGGRSVVAYCGSGVTACVNLLSLELAGIRNARLYAGSWSDWCSRPGATIASSDR